MGALPTIAIDAMGGDGAPQVPVVAACQIAASRRARVLLVGDEARLLTLLPGRVGGLDVVHAATVVGASDPPVAMVRERPDSSMHRLFELVRDGAAQAAVSGGNTGALVTIGRAVLGMLPGIDRPGILATLPTVHGRVRLIDVGASLRARHEHLVQFALMGVARLSVDASVGRLPRVALLNVGTEANKGTAAIRAAALTLQQLDSLDYRGFVEGDAIFEADLDLIVTDGFAGNVALKVAEGSARMARHLLTSALAGADSTAGRPPAGPRPGPGSGLDLRALLDVRRRNGASLLGLNGSVIKSHGNADADAFLAAASQAVDEALAGLPQHIAAALARACLAPPSNSMTTRVISDRSRE